MIPDLSQDDLPWPALARYFAGELSLSESRELQGWIDADPTRPVLIEELRALWVRTDARQSWDAEVALRQIKQTASHVVRLLPSSHGERQADSRRPRWMLPAIQVAAALAVLVGGTVLWRARQLSSPTAEIAVVSTRPGQRRTLRLADGTDVVLAPASTLRYSVAVGRGLRAVSLEGKASFRVTHDESRPFVVRTRHGSATDLGTRFVVQAYADDSAAAVAVAEGKVSWRASTADSLLLVPQTGGLATASGELAVLENAEVQRLLGWLDGRLEFRETPMAEAAVALGRWYDLDVRFADTAIARKRLTASFKDEPVSEVLRLLAATLDAKIDLQGNAVTIRAR